MTHFGGLVGVAVQGGCNGLDDGLGDGFIAGFAFPIPEDIGEPADDGGVGVAIAMLEAEKFSQFFEGRMHESILPHKEEIKHEGHVGERKTKRKKTKEREE